MISVKGLTRTYGDFLAVNGVSFQISQGEIVGLLGHNGAGKTTLMKMLTGYLQPDVGIIEVDGLFMGQSRRVIQQKMGYLPENCPVYPEMTVIDYLRYASRLQGLSGSAADQAVLRAIEQTALQEKAMATIATLSRGLRQRVGVAQAILHQPQILILDEPTNGLDPSQIHHMRDLIKSLAENATVIVSTHILQEVQAVCDRVIIMRRGELALDARLDELCRSHRLLLQIEATLADLKPLINKVNGIHDIVLLEQNLSSSQFALSLNEDVSVNDISPAIARYVHDNNWPLYALHPEARDLESVFGQINAEGTQGGQG